MLSEGHTQLHRTCEANAEEYCEPNQSYCILYYVTKLLSYNEGYVRKTNSNLQDCDGCLSAE